MKLKFNLVICWKNPSMFSLPVSKMRKRMMNIKMKVNNKKSKTIPTRLVMNVTNEMINCIFSIVLHFISKVFSFLKQRNISNCNKHWYFLYLRGENKKDQIFPIQFFNSQCNSFRLVKLSLLKVVLMTC